MQPYLVKFQQWLRSAVQQNGDVQAEATMETLRRIRIFAAAVLMINLVYTAEFWFHVTGKESPLRASWANAIGWTHFITGMTMVIFGLLVHRFYRRSEHSSIQATVLQILFCASCLLFAIALSVIDQMVTPNTTNFAMICLIVAMTSLMRPAMTLLIFSATYLVFYQALAITQQDADLLAMARSHSASAVLMSVIASVVVWRQYVAAVLLRREITRAHKELADNQIELAIMATRDSLTGLYVRREFMRLAEIELARAARTPTDTGVLMVDLDFFKKINDRYGHPAGDEVLQQVAAMLTKGVRATDLVARMGGEEFIVLMPNTSRDSAMAVAEKLRHMLREHPLQIDGLSIAVTASVGVTGLAEKQRGSVEKLYAAADHALYSAKQLGRDRVEYAASEATDAPTEFTGSRK